MTTTDGHVPASTTHRALTVVAIAAVMAQVEPERRAVAATHPTLGVATGALYAVLIALAAVGLGVRARRTLNLVDAGVLAVAVAVQVVVFRAAWTGRSRYTVDESYLAHAATVAIAHAHSPYGQAVSIPGGFTSLFNGGYPTSFGYPPLAPMLGAVVSKILPFASETTATSFLALVASGVLTFVLVPPSLRPLAVLSVFVVTPIAALSIQSYPIVVATPFLILAVWRFPMIGAQGRLGRTGVLQAVALGLASATQQLVWFAVPFLLVGIWRMRRGELEAGPAAKVVGRFAAVGALTFVIVNSPFIVASPHQWLIGITDPLRQHAFFSGPGFANVSLRIFHGSGALQFYSYAALALYLTLLAASALFPRRLGPGALLLPFAVFYLGVRSQAVYYQSALPALFVAFADAGPAVFAAARPLGVDRLRVPARWAVPVRRAVPVLGAVVTAALLAVAVLTPSPLRLTVQSAQRQPRQGDVPAMSLLRVRVSNTSDEPVRPHFLTDYGPRNSLFWTILSGPRTLAPHRRGDYLLRSHPKQGNNRFHLVWVVSDDPQTVLRTLVPRRLRTVVTVASQGAGLGQREPRHT